MALILGLTLCWGGNWIAIKVALGHLQPWTYRALTSQTGGMILLALTAAMGQRVWPRPGEWRPLAICGAFNITIWHMLTAYALIAMGTGHVALLAHTMPIWSALIAVVVLRDPLTPRLIVATALGGAGIVALFLRHVDLVAGAPFAPLLGLGAAFGWAIGTLYQKRQTWSLAITAMAGWQLIIASAPVALVAVFWEGLVVPPLPIHVWAALAFTVLVSQVLSYIFWFKIIEIFPAQIAALATLFAPLVGVILSAVLLGDPLGWPEVLAMALCGAALALVQFAPGRIKPE